MPMSPRLLRPRASGATHPEALDWASRVTANGGTVSTNTLAAVSTFCASIDRESGLRAAILRCNLFCGNSDANLAAVRTPLYLSGSLGGAAIGNTTDTNVNFAQADYQETGSGGGLKGNGTTKYLNTGFNASTGIPSSISAHLSYSATSVETSGDRAVSGSWSGNVSTGFFGASAYDAFASRRLYRIGSTLGDSPSETSPTSSVAHYLVSRTSATNLAGYAAGVLQGTGTSSVTPAFYNGSVFVFCFHNQGSPGGYTAARVRMYSIGNGLTAAQALAFSNAVVAFNTTLGRA